MKKRVLSRVLAVALALAMCISMLPMAVFADHNTSTDETKNLLVFGASTSSGYGLADFINENAGFAVENNDISENAWSYEAASQYNTTHPKRGRISETSYPWQLKQYIQETEGVDVDLSAMTLNGMRTNELRALLDEDYYEAVYQWELSTTCPSYNPQGSPYDDIGFLTNHIRSFTYHLGRGGAAVDGVPVSTDGGWSPNALPGGESYRRASAYTKKEIENADIIVVDVCMNNFGTYLAERVAGKHNVPGKEYAENYWKQNKEDIVGVSPKAVELADSLKKTLKMTVSALSSPSAEEFLDSFIYCYCDCITNFSADINMIREINPDAKIIAVGVYNTLDGINLVFGDQVIDFGAVAAKGFDLVNGYIKGLDQNSSNYYYADVSGGIETFMNQIRNSESFDDLMADESGLFLMENMYDSFIDSFVGRTNLVNMVNQQAQGNYAALAEGYSAQGIVLPGWNGSDDKVVGTTYLTQSGPSTSPDNALTKMMIIAGVMQNQGMDPAMFDSLPGETQAAIVEGAKGYYNSSVVPSYTEGGVAPKDWDELELDEKITGKTYVTFNPQAESQTDMFQPEPTGTRTDVTYLTQKGFSQFVEDTIKDRVQRLLYSAGTITDIHLDELMEDLKDMNGVTEDITNALATGEEPSASTMELLHVVDRFILYQGVGQHPSKKGCEAMADDVLLAYQKLASGGNTAFDDMKEQIMAMLESVKSIFDGTPIGADIDDAITKLAAVKEMMDIIDEQGLTADDLREFLALKEQFQDLFTETLDLLGLSVDDLKQAMEETTPEQLAEIVNKIKDLKELVDILDEEGLTADQLKEVLQMKKDLEARMNEVLDALGLTMDDVMAMLDENSSPEKIKEYVEKYQQIKEILDVLDESGLTADQLKQALQLKEDLEEGLNKTLDALGITIDDLIAQGKFVANAVDWEKVAEIIKTVNDIVQDLPGAQAELEAKIKEYIEELLVPVEAFIDDVMKTAQEIYDAVDVNEIAKAVEKVNEILENLPTTEEVRAMIEEQIAAVQEMIKEKAAEYISEDLMKQLEDLAEMLKKAVDENDYSEIIDKLMPIGQQLLEIAEAVRDLPEYEKAMNEYIELSNAAMAGLEDRVATLEKQMAKVIAKSIDVEIKADVTFPNKKVQTDVSWKLDEDAAGYVFTVDGKETAASETENGLAYTHTAQKVGQKYTYEVTPYIVAQVDGETKTVYGKTFTKVVTPKVKVAKAKIKSVKAAKKAFTAKWKAVKGADGYQVSYKTGKKTKKVLVKGAKKVSKKVKKLQSKKQYTVKVRAYKIVNGKKYWGKWSAAKKVKVK